MEIAAIFVTSFLVGLSGAMSPGPFLAVVVARASLHGFWVGPTMVVGHSLLELAAVVALVAGSQRFLSDPTVSSFVTFFGGAFLIVIAIALFRSGAKYPYQSCQPAFLSRSNLVWLGMLVSLSNVYWFIWWNTIGAAYILIALNFGLAGVIAFYLGHILSDFAWYSLVAFLTGLGKQVAPGFIRLVIPLSALFLLGMGLYFIGSGAALLV